MFVSKIPLVNSRKDSVFMLVAIVVAAVLLLQGKANAGWLSHGSWHEMCRSGDQLTVHFIRNSSNTSYLYGAVTLGNKGGEVYMGDKTSEYISIYIPSGVTAGDIMFGSKPGGSKGGQFTVSSIPTCDRKGGG